MPIIAPGSWLNPETKPDWTGIAAIGRFVVATEGGRFERHHHDDDEVWMIWEGKGKILLEGSERYVQAGDIVLTQAGDTHDIVEVYETLRGFFVESGLPAGGRMGHLHTSESDASGHDVPAAPVPRDFPTR
jgi:mannose-6-phosphate isomerase-like protein (cupin superfamily)